MKTTVKLALLGASAAALTLAARPASAWDSICYGYDDVTKKVADLQFTPGSRGCEGIEAARGRWRDPEKHVDEHRRVLELAAAQGGLPASVLETMKLSVLTDQAAIVVLGKDGLTPTIDPTYPLFGKRAVYRAFAIDEMAQLPDFSFSLWDWARGNEKCPLDPLPGTFGTARTCHQFSSHMGATNSNHFPPQSNSWFDHYHGLAMQRAADCTATRKAIWNAEPAARRPATDARLFPYFRACEVEALTYEAIAQHFLQDGWSAGHMWQRWGSTDIGLVTDLAADGNGSAEATWNGLDPRVRRLLIAEIVSVSAGTIHGSDPALYETIPGGITMHDRLCYPHEDVTAIDQGAEIQVTGDLHLHDVVGGPPLHSDISITGLPYDVSVLTGQSQRLLDCASGSVGAVYAALSDATFGDPTLGAPLSPPPPFDATDCRAPQITNKAFYEGIDKTDIQPAFGEYKAVLIDDIPDSVEALARQDYSRLRRAAKIVAKADPLGTELSTLQLTQPYTDEFCDADTGMCNLIEYTAPPELFTMVKQEPNRCYDATAPKPGCTVPAPPASPLAPYADPAVPNPLGPLNLNEPETTLALAFHASHAPELCDSLSPASLAAVSNLVNLATTPEDRATACDVCAEWIAPFLRIGVSEQDHDTKAEPLCYFTSQQPNNVPYVYEPNTGTADATALARRHCGCKGLVAVTDAGVRRLDAIPSGSEMTFMLKGANVPVGTLSRDLAAASRGRLLISNGQGQIAGVREDTEIDLDDDPMNGLTRVKFSGVTDIQGIAVANVAGKELLLAATPGTGELIAWDLTSSTQCDRLSVAQVAGQGAYDVVVSGDASTVWVSVRKTSPLSGAVAQVSLPALAKCDGSAAGTLQWIAMPALAGPGPMALSPNGSRLAVGGRLATTCPDQVKMADGLTNQTIQVGCDRVYVLDVATTTWLLFEGFTSLPTRPGRFPYALSWLGDSTRIAYASFQGVDNLGAGDSGWPKNFSAAPRIPIGGTLRLADVLTPSYTGGGGATLRHWTYNIPLEGYVGGPTVVAQGGAMSGSAWVYTGTTYGRISAYSVAAHDASADPMWEAATADPESGIHTVSGAWYGGCSHTCGIGNGICPTLCPGASSPPGFGSIELGSPVRVLASY